MKNFFLLSVVIVLLGCKENAVSHAPVKECVIDVNKSLETLDVSNLFTDDLETIPLETTEECLISDMLKVQFTDDFIYVSDQIAQCVFQFSKSGEFIKSIGHRGESPAEYSSLGDFTVNDKYLYIQDLYGNKILRYSLNTDLVEVIPLGDIGIDEMIDFGTHLYCISNYRNYKDECFNLYKLDLSTRKMEGVISADAKVAEKHSAWGLNRYASKNEESALLIYPLNDTIYTITKDSVFPQMVIRFSERSLPEHRRYRNAMETIDQSSEYILGMDHIRNSAKYIFFEYGDRGIQKNAIINKETSSYETSDRLVLEKYGNLYLTSFEICDNDFYIIQPIDFYKRLWTEIYSKESFRNEEHRNLFEKLFNGLRDDDNPIIFKLHMK